MGRGLAWLGLGFAVLVAAIVLTAPELAFADPGGTTGLVLLTLAAGVPGFVLLLVIAAKRRGREPQPDDQEDR